jgi:hypothetical protein
MKNHFKQFKDTDWLFVAVALIAAAAIGGVYLFMLAIGLLVAFFKPLPAFGIPTTAAKSEHFEDDDFLNPSEKPFTGWSDDVRMPTAGGYWFMGVYHSTDD